MDGGKVLSCEDILKYTVDIPLHQTQASDGLRLAFLRRSPGQQLVNEGRLNDGGHQ